VYWERLSDYNVTLPGTKQDRFIGCAVGCTLESVRVIHKLPVIDHSRHKLFEKYLGIPEALALRQDDIFEGLDGDRMLTWPREFLAAIPVGADLRRAVEEWERWGDYVFEMDTPEQADRLLEVLKGCR
jgi:hypothetical protein